jgi:hypothetical protein
LFTRCCELQSVTGTNNKHFTAIHAGNELNTCIQDGEQQKFPGNFASFQQHVQSGYQVSGFIRLAKSTESRCRIASDCLQIVRCAGASSLVDLMLNTKQMFLMNRRQYSFCFSSANTLPFEPSCIQCMSIPMSVNKRYQQPALEEIDALLDGF